MRERAEKASSILFLSAALASSIAVGLICVFLFSNGLPAITKIGLFHFLGGREWSPVDTPPVFGILPMLLGSIYITAGAILIGVPIGVLFAVFLAFACPKKIRNLLRPCVEVMAGIPSVIYGFFGMTLVVPRTGNSIISASILLGIMILPTVIGIADSALSTVSSQYVEGALALGASRYRSVFFVALPAAKSGIIAAVVLGIGRAIGETMAVVMVAGNQARVPTSATKGARTLTANIAIEMGYASGLHREALIATGVVLFIFILLINVCINQLKGKKK